MSTAKSVKAQLYALLNQANNTTGKADTNLTAAIDSLAAGFGQGGGGGDTSAEDGLITRTLTEYTNNRVTEVAGNAFASNTVIESVSFPNVTKIGKNSFNGCSNLKTINFPSVNTFGGNDFRSCTSLTEVAFPAINRNVPSLQYCSALVKVDLGSSGRYFNNIGQNSMGGCTSLETVIIRSSTMVTLINVNAFTNTPFASGGTGGTIYVPEALIESYQTETNWSSLYAAGTCNFVAIEGSEYE